MRTEKTIHKEYENYLDNAVRRVNKSFILISLKNIRKTFIPFIKLFTKYDKTTQEEAKKLAEEHIKYYREKAT